MGRWVGLQKLIIDLDMRNGHKGGLKVGFIYMYNNDGGKEGAYVYEAYEAKHRVAHFRAPVCFINFLPRYRYYTHLYYLRSAYYASLTLPLI